MHAGCAAGDDDSSAARDRSQGVLPRGRTDVVDDRPNLARQRLVRIEGAMRAEPFRQRAARRAATCGPEFQTTRPTALRLVAQISKPAARPSWISAVAIPPDAPCTSRVSPGSSFDLVNRAR